MSHFLLQYAMIRDIKTHSTNFNNIVRLLKGSVFVQIFQLAATFILTYYYSKNDFGVLSYIISISAFFEIIVGVQYNTASIVSLDKEHAKKLMLISSIMAIVITLLGTLILVLVKYRYPTFIEQGIIFNVVLLIPLLIFSNFLFNNGLMILKYFGLFKSINRLRIIYVFSMFLLKLFAAIVFHTLYSLIIAHLLALLLCVVCYVVIFRKNILPIVFTLHLKESLDLLKSYSKFPRFSLLSNLISAAATISFPLLIKYFYGFDENGIYYLTGVFIFQPLLLIIQAISDAFLPEVKSMFHNEKNRLLKFIKKQQKQIFIITFLYILIAIIAGEYFFKWILPQKWQEVGGFIKYIAIFYLFTNIYIPYSFVADYLGQQKYLLIFNSLLFLVQFLTLYLLHQHISFNVMMLLISFITSFFYLYINFNMLGKLKKSQ